MRFVPTSIGTAVALHSLIFIGNMKRVLEFYGWLPAGGRLEVRAASQTPNVPTTPLSGLRDLVA